jgi:small subunit ribosomal protein S15
MALSKERKEKVIKKYRTHDSDTGSPQVQIAILTEEIRDLTEHLKSHKQDFSSRVGLLRKVQERKRMMKYLQREDEKALADLLKSLKVKYTMETLPVEKEETVM